jgi:hypothetical protein
VVAGVKEREGEESDMVIQGHRRIFVVMGTFSLLSVVVDPPKKHGVKLIRPKYRE